MMRRFLPALFLALAFLAIGGQAPPGLTWGPGPQQTPISQSANNLGITVPVAAFGNGNSNNLNNTAFGILAMASSTQSAGNVAMGYKALNALNAGAPAGFETAIGEFALMNDASGTFNTAVGSATLRYFTGAASAAGNIALGHGALGGDDTSPVSMTASYDTCLGAWCGQEITTSIDNTMVGMSAGVEVQGGSGQNVFMGMYAGSGCASGVACTDNLAGVTTPNQNVYVGYGAGWAINSTSNTGVGYESQLAMVSGQLNTSVGRVSLTTDVTGVRNTCVGNNTCQLQNGGNDNTEVGEFAGRQNASGIQNVYIGSQTGTSNTSGSSNVMVGYNLQTVAVGTSNEVDLGGMFFANNNSTAAPAVSACGTNSIDAHANNVSGQVNITAGTPSSCTVTLAGTGYGTWNHCQVTAETANSTFGYSYTLTAITLTGTSLAGKFDYQCQGV